jgi:peptidoglycan/LPS O-acetylase OafA/YrhL
VFALPLEQLMSSAPATPHKLAADLPSRIPSLDGMRAVSIGLVLISHLMYSSGSRNAHLATAAGSLGGFGVEVFFVISGFIITHLLLKESDRTGTISLRNFYIRRAFRIWPAYYVFLGTIFILQRARVLGLPTPDIIAAGAFVWNYSHASNTWLAHTWSLSVEEQFYLFWPALLWIFGARRALGIALALLIIVPVVRIATLLALPSTNFLVWRMGLLGHTRMDAMMFGCVTAILLGHRAFRDRVMHFLERGGRWIALACLVASYALTQFVPYWLQTAGYSLEGMAIALMLIWLVCRAEGGMGRVLNRPVLVHLGLISFSLYLWQQLFINEKTIPLLRYPPMCLICAFALAEFSYWCIERPFLRTREHWTKGRARPSHYLDSATETKPASEALAPQVS